MNVVYFIQRTDGDIKIGTCGFKRLPTRLAELEGKYGDIVFYGYIEGGVEKESELHNRFSEYQRVMFTHRYSVPCKTEFFAPDESIVSYIETHCGNTAQTVKRSPKQYAVNPDKVAELLSNKFGSWHDIKRKQVARDTGLTPDTVIKWVHRRIRHAMPDTIDVWCKYLGCEPSSIVIGERRRLRYEARRMGCEFPGQRTNADRQAPEALRYLPMTEHLVDSE